MKSEELPTGDSSGAAVPKPKLCSSECERVYWDITSATYEESDLTKSDDDCPTPSEGDIQAAILGAMATFGRENDSPAHCAEGCHCNLGKPVLVWSERRDFLASWTKHIHIEGHDHTCEYSIPYQGLLSKYRQKGECVPNPGVLKTPRKRWL